MIRDNKLSEKCVVKILTNIFRNMRVGIFMYYGCISRDGKTYSCKFHRVLAGDESEDVVAIVEYQCWDGIKDSRDSCRIDLSKHIEAQSFKLFFPA